MKRIITLAAFALLVTAGAAIAAPQAVRAIAHGCCDVAADCCDKDCDHGADCDGGHCHDC